MPSDRDNVLRNSSMLPAAALREMRGQNGGRHGDTEQSERKLHEAKGIRSASSPAHPAPRTGSEMREAKFVFTITLICTAALPRMAGTISRKI